VKQGRFASRAAPPWAANPAVGPLHRTVHLRRPTPRRGLSQSSHFRRAKPRQKSCLETDWEVGRAKSELGEQLYETWRRPAAAARWRKG
jgi:hypothetical protein